MAKAYKAGYNLTPDLPDSRELDVLLVPLLQDWFHTLENASPGQQAAGKVAANMLLKLYQDITTEEPFGQDSTAGGRESSTQSERRLLLQQLDAKFESGYFGGSDPTYGYVGNWLDEVKDSDRDSAGGKFAITVWMASTRQCNPTLASYQSFIAMGEDLLKRGMENSIAARMHFILADAYADMVAIADGVNPDGYYTHEKFDGEAENRAKALRHYRTGLALDGSSERAKLAWRHGWRLAAGLAPATRYACFTPGD